MKRLSLAILFAVSAFGIDKTSVQVRSYDCGTGTGITTTGVPVTLQNHFYVLTSSWGVLEEKESCHDVFDPSTRQTYTAKLAILDWGTGFAALEVSELPAIDINALTNPLPSTAKVEILGFSKNGEPQTKNGRVIASKSSRHHFPTLPYSFELVSDRVSNTYVGAPVFGKTLDGIVASQWIEIVAGSRARIHEWKTKEGENPNQLVVLPISLLREKLLSNQVERSSFQDANSKLTDRSVLHLGKYRWEVFCPEGAGDAPPDGIGPIGGSDGVGVGGPLKGSISCKAEVRLQGNSTLQSPAFFPEAFEKDLENGLASYESLEIPFLVYRNAGKNFERVPFLTLGQLFTELNREGRHWLLVPNKLPTEGHPSYVKFVQENARLTQVLLDTFPLVAEREDDRRDYRFLYTHAVLFGSLNWKLFVWKDWLSVSGIPKGDFTQGIMWQGKELVVLIKEMLEKMEWLHKQAAM